MSQHDYDFANQSGSLFRSDLNSFASSVVSNNSGASEPATKFAYMWWPDTTTGWMKQRNSTNTAWVKAFRLSNGGSLWRQVSARSSNSNIVESDFGALIRATSAFTQGATAASSFDNGFWFSFRNDSNGDCVFDPAGADQINGLSSLAIPAGTSLDFVCSGAAWFTRGEVVRVEAGSIKPWPSLSIPAGWLDCNGAQVSQTTYAALYTVLGSTFNIGGETAGNFRLPDFQGRFPIGVGSGSDSIVAASVDDGNDAFIVNSNIDRTVQGMAVTLTTTGALPTGLATSTTYFLIKNSATSVSFASTQINASYGIKVPLSGSGSGVHSLALSLQTRSLGQKGGEETHSQSFPELCYHNHGNFEAGAFNINKATLEGLVAKDSRYSGVAIDIQGQSYPFNVTPPYIGMKWVIKT